MADRRYTASTRSRYGYQENRNSAYVYGNVVTNPAYVPRKVEEQQRERKVSHQVRHNRRNALRMNVSYVWFLAICAVVTLFVCVGYIRLQASLTNHSNKIASMQEELANLREANTTKYNAVMDSVNLNEVREKAQGKLGMVYANPDQIVEYKSPSSDYVEQYENIPKDGVLASDKKK